MKPKSSETKNAAKTTADELALLVDSIEDYALFLLSPEGIIRSWNRGAARVMGSPLTRSSEPHSPASTPRRTSRRTSLAGSSKSPNAKAASKTKDGGFETMASALGQHHHYPLRDPDGKLRGFAKVTRDLTERREGEERLRRSEEMLSLLVGSVQDYAIFMLNPRDTLPRGTRERSGSRVTGPRRSSAIIFPSSIPRKTSTRGNLNANWKSRWRRAVWKTKGGAFEKTAHVSWPTSSSPRCVIARAGFAASQSDS